MMPVTMLMKESRLQWN